MVETLTIRLSGGPSAPARARSALRSLDQSLEGLGGDTTLLVSELVTNSVRHGGAVEGDEIVLVASSNADRVRVEVSDPGPGFDASEPPRPSEVGGYGLQLVDQLAHRWGIKRQPRARVWFEIDRPEPPAI